MSQSRGQRASQRARPGWTAPSSRRTRPGWAALSLTTSLIACAACDPLIDVAGAFFPAWILCILAGIGATVLVRQLLSRSRLEASVGPVLVVYPSLAVAVSLALWLAFYRQGP